MQSTALEILTLAVLQGLCHPIQCMPYLVALETADLPTLQKRAGQLHLHLATKHGSLLLARHAECAWVAFTFQTQSSSVPTPQGLRGNPPVALFQTWYSLLRERRASRNEFLRNLARTLDIDSNPSSYTEVRSAEWPD